MIFVLIKQIKSKFLGGGCSSGLEYLPNLCMAPGFIPHCPNCIIYILPLCLLNTTPLLLPPGHFSGSPPYLKVFPMCLEGGGRRFYLYIVGAGGRRGKFHMSVIWGGGDVIRCSGIASWNFHHCPGTSILRTPPVRNWRWKDKESDQCSRTLAYSPSTKGCVHIWELEGCWLEA